MLDYNDNTHTDLINEAPEEPEQNTILGGFPGYEPVPARAPRSIEILSMLDELNILDGPRNRQRSSRSAKHATAIECPTNDFTGIKAAFAAGISKIYTPQLPNKKELGGVESSNTGAGAAASRAH